MNIRGEAFLEQNKGNLNIERTQEQLDVNNKRRRENNIESKLVSLYISINETFSDKEPKEPLINKKGTEDDYVNNKQTKFGEKLKELLYIISGYCTNYINKLFGNYNLNIYTSAVGCKPSSNIYKLYDYLKNDKFTWLGITNMTEEDRKKEKKILKEQLKIHLLNICQNEEDKAIIRNTSIREGDYINPTYDDPFLQHNLEAKEAEKEYERLNGPTKFGGGQRGKTKIKKTTKKEILGKERCIYKKSGDRKEYLKYKGGLITVSEYKKLMKFNKSKFSETIPLNN
jgi:hypothetical protein